MGIKLSACTRPKKAIMDQERSHYSQTCEPEETSRLRSRDSFLISPSIGISVPDSRSISKWSTPNQEHSGKFKFKRPSFDFAQIPSDSYAFACKRPCLSEEEEITVLDSWKILREDMRRTGTTIFINMFSEFPEIVRLFVKHGRLRRNSIECSVIVVEHGLYVMSLIEKVLARLLEHENLESVLYAVGDCHRMKRVGRCAFMQMIPFFITAIKPSFDVWTVELERSWLKFMQLVCHVIGERLHQ